MRLLLEEQSDLGLHCFPDLSVRKLRVITVCILTVLLYKNFSKFLIQFINIVYIVQFTSHIIPFAL